MTDSLDEDGIKKSRASSADELINITRRDDKLRNDEMNLSGVTDFRDPVGNAQNLFDDSDREDEKWLKVARIHLDKWTSRR